MARLFKYFLVAFTTFMIGISFAYQRAANTTLEDISRNIDHFEGSLVEVETFAQTDGDLGWTLVNRSIL